MQNKKLIALIILSVGAVISLVYGILSPPEMKRKVLSKETAAVRRSEDVKTIEWVVPAKRYTKRTDFADWGKNPFLPKEVHTMPLTSLTLNGIVWDEDTPKAIINGEIVGVGDILGENRVVDIKPDKVILNDGTADLELTLEE